MTKAGRNTFKGINSQAWAAMSLFLQYVSHSDFRYIGFEGDKLEDFHLVFKDGHRVICESKASKLNYSQIRNILSEVIKHKQINPEDDVLIICKEVNLKAKSDIENFRFFETLLRSKLTKKRFTKKHLSLLSQVKFWEVTQEIGIESVELLIAELLKIWVPDHSLKEIVRSLVVNNVYFGSQKGNRLTKLEFLQQLDEKKKQIVDDSGYYSARDSKETQIEEIVEGLSDPDRKVWANNQLSALTNKPDLHYFTLKRLEEKGGINLRDWSYLWRASARGIFSLEVFKVFKQNISNSENQNYFLEFIPEVIDKFAGFYTWKFLGIDIVRICKEIINNTRNYDNEVLSVVKQLFLTGFKEIFYVKQKEDTRWEREEISKLLEELYEKTSSKIFKENIIKYIVGTFNLIKDDGEYWHYTPRAIFEILRQYAKKDTENRVLELKKIFIIHYAKFYKKYSKKLQFKGWEHMGGLTSFWGHNYKVSNRHFVEYTLKPALWDYYQKHKIRAWRFIINNCITPTNKVNKDHPDFLNRASIPIILNRYRSKDKKISQEAFEILKEFVLSRKGIPHKSDLVYQELKGDFSDDKKWQLIKVSIDKHKMPENPFIAQITLGLSRRGNKEAKEAVKDWIKNPKYHQRGRFFESDIVGIISQFLDFSFNEGVEIFKGFIDQDYFLNKMDSFDAFYVASLLNKIINKDIKAGLKILKSLSQKPKLTSNEQILLCNSLTGEGDFKQENEKVLIETYNGFLKPFLNSLNNDSKKIERKITRSGQREAIVKFADALAKHKKISEAIKIVKIFINDSDPCTPKKVNSEDPEGKYDEHNRIERGEETYSITTVRGWCAWVLMNCAVLDGRDHIPEIIDLTEKLTRNENHYIKHMACFPLSQLAQNRLTVLPDKRDVLFLNDNKNKALELSKKIEKIAFSLLKNISECSENAQKVLGKSILTVFNHIRALNQADTLRLIKTFQRFPEEAIAEAAPLFIYFAEFRQKDFKDWKWKMPGLYDDLENFDNKEFQKLLKNILKKKNSKINSQFTLHFKELVKSSVPDEANVKNAIKYSQAFEISYKYLNFLADSYDHQAFENIYCFIQDNINKKFEDCYELWRKCLKEERSTMEKLIKEGKIQEITWWPFYYNDEILAIVKQKGGNEKFLDSFEFLLHYPEPVNIGNVNNAIEVLKSLPEQYRTQVNKLFNKLVEKNPNFYDIREEWRKKQ